MYPVASVTENYAVSDRVGSHLREIISKDAHTLRQQELATPRQGSPEKAFVLPCDTSNLRSKYLPLYGANRHALPQPSGNPYLERSNEPLPIALVDQAIGQRGSVRHS